MATTAQTSQTTKKKSKDQYDREAKERTANIIQQLKAGKLNGKVKALLIVGPVGAGKTSLVRLLTGLDMRIEHTMQNGTVMPICTFAEIGGQPFIFIDTPGFGFAKSPPAQVKDAIHSTVGEFTRVLGGIHGILYVQSIVENRFSTGMRESIEFLNKLARDSIRPNITFITTQWDRVVNKDLGKRRMQESEMKIEQWGDFRVGEPNGARYFKHLGVDCDDATVDEIQDAKVALTNGVMSYYRSREVGSLAMPFSEWTTGEKVGFIVFKGITNGAKLVVAGIVVAVFAIGIAGGLPVEVGGSFSIST